MVDGEATLPMVALPLLIYFFFHGAVHGDLGACGLVDGDALDLHLLRILRHLPHFLRLVKYFSFEQFLVLAHGLVLGVGHLIPYMIIMQLLIDRPPHRYLVFKIVFYINATVNAAPILLPDVRIAGIWVLDC